MKKITSAALCLMFLLSFPLAAFSTPTIDWSQYTVDELHAIQKEIESEITKRSAIVAESAVPPKSEYIALMPNDRGASVLALKARLQELGYLAGAQSNDVYTGNTKAAVKEFQTLNGLAADGVASAETQEILFSDAAFPKPTPAPTPAPTPVQAPSTVDMSALEALENFSYTFDKMENSISIKPKLSINSFFSSGCAIMPNCLSTSIDGARLTMLGILFVYRGVSPIGLEKVIILVDDVRYSISFKSEKTNGDLSVESYVLGCGKIGLEMLSAIATTDGSVEVRFDGSSRNVDFVMSDLQVSSIRELYAAYVESGALEQDNLWMLDSVYPITKQ